ncbi:MAG TPA: class I SAM-dependent methyltransferase, partial [Desulfobaccales bacterium]|nr:class I SAM-dependent methyltransferase [Desulfobaccales bacterium]
TSIFQVKHFEPPPRLYAVMAQSSLMRLIYRRFVADLAEGLPLGTSLLDVGTGPSYLLGYLGQVRPDLNLWGLDFDYGMISRARPRQKALTPQAEPRWLVADACLLPFPEGVFDHVVSTFSFHVWPCPVTGLKELLRVLKPRGRAWVYELRREASFRDLQSFARETGLPWLFVFLGYQTVRWQHAWGEQELDQDLRQAASGRRTLRPAHHIFWRAELQAA